MKVYTNNVQSIKINEIANDKICIIILDIKNGV